MKAKRLLLGFILWMILSIQTVFAIPISELDPETKEVVLNFVSEKITDVPETTLEELDGERYEVLGGNEDYVVIEFDGMIYLVPQN